VGLDSKVVVWSGFTFEKLKTLMSHQSHVKGITFDPANKYFATASDDRTIKIFRFTPPGPNSTAHDQMNNFQLDKTIIAPFTQSPLTTYFRRCSWSPDGNHIAAANSTNGPVSSVSIINRGVWDSDINLIGHENPVEVCAFAPRLFSLQEPSRQTEDAKGFSLLPLVTVVACAGQDKMLSIWNTSSARPIVVSQHLTNKSISDLAWSPDANALFFTSLDGTIMCMLFEAGDLGWPVDLQENEKALAKFGAGRRGAGVIEGTGGMLMEEMSKEGEIRGAEGRMGELMGDASAVQAAVPSVQTNGVAVNGSGQTPLPHLVSGIPAAVPNGNSTQVSDEQRRAAKQAEQTRLKLENMKQRTTITKDGKKRIAPLLISSSSGAAHSSLPKPQLMQASSSSQGTRSDAPQSILDLSKAYDGLPKGGLSALLLGNRRKTAVLEGEDGVNLNDRRIEAASRNGATAIVMNGVDGLEPAQSVAPLPGIQPTPEFIRPAIVNPNLSVSTVRLAVPKVRSVIVRTLEGEDRSASTANSSTSSDDSAIFEARNASGPSSTGRPQDRDPSRITVTKKGQTVWQDFLPRSVLLVTGNQNLWAAACEEGSVYVWTPAGRRLLNALVVEAQPVILESRGWFVLCITAVGTCHVWNIRTLSSPHPPVSLAPVLDIAIHSLIGHPSNAPAVTSAHINTNGNIVITLTNGDGYTYSPTMFVWQRVTEVWWATGSQYWNTTDSAVGNLQSSADQATDGTSTNTNISAGIIPHLERSTTTETVARGRSYYLQKLIKTLLSKEGYEGFESAVSIAHLENRIAAALQLGAREEFRVYLFMYAKRLGAEGLKGKVEELLRGLLGKMFEDDPSKEGFEGISKDVGRGWEGEEEDICGWSRHELLKGVLLILGMLIPSAILWSYVLLTNTICRQTSRYSSYHGSVC
jgi:protein HIRA/HIR1